MCHKTSCLVHPQSIIPSLHPPRIHVLFPLLLLQKTQARKSKVSSGTSVSLGERRISCHLRAKEALRRHRCLWVEASLKKNNCHCSWWIFPEESQSGGGCLSGEAFQSVGGSGGGGLGNAASPARWPSC